MQIIKIWKSSFEKYKRHYFVSWTSETFQNHGQAQEPIRTMASASIATRLPDIWSHILFNMLHHTHIQCEIEDFEEVSKHVTLHEALYGAMGMEQAR